MDSKALADPTRILKVAPTESSDDRELAFELDFLAGLTIEQRFSLMFERSREMAEMLRAHGHAEASSIAKRT
jgi:hypothetical protein